ncbi:sugar O-acetyltransferase [Anaeromicropila herbilytica]|uniref:Nodulation protein L n=1 Tax=Anaeromicropila herbilytica TaxID=2785025 RepID=A0A7R7IDG8_9FIRM|nr:sugar O-acetyltransferase [Anaeromicropila herbilytica]BCN31054.1 nodulation protein L [Anaeromicropila herbilytica]
MENDIFEQLKNGEPVEMMSESYLPAIEHMNRTRKLCFKINHTEPDSMELPQLFEQMFMEPLPENTYIVPPLEIDFGKQIKLGKQVFINHSFTCMSAGGITIEENTQIGPQATFVTTNHDFDARYTLKCKGIHIGKNVWIGARVTIMPGITVGDNAVIAGGAVVTKDVEPNTVVGGNPAKILKRLDA